MKDLESANFQFELSMLENLLETQGFQTQLIQASPEILIDMLIVELPPTPIDPAPRIIISFIPLDASKFPELKLIQLHASTVLNLQPIHQEAVKSFLLNINNGVAVGSFALGDDSQLYFRQVIPLEKGNIIEGAWFLSIFSLFMQMFQVFLPLIHEVNEGQKTHAEALRSAFQR